MPLIFFANSFVNTAGAIRFIEICFSQELEVKLSNLSFSNNEALLTRQSKNLIFDFEVSVEIREEHATVGKQNMERLREILPEFPNWHLIIDDMSDITEKVEVICSKVDAAIIDMAEPWNVLKSVSSCLRVGGRVACYCPTSSQLEKSWNTCEEENLSIEWAGEIIERKWSKASKGGVRPGNQPMGHTAFLLIATKLASQEEE